MNTTVKMHTICKLFICILSYSTLCFALQSANISNNYIKEVKSCLAPTPKQSKITGEITLSSPYAIDDSLMKMPLPAISLLKKEFTSNYGWKNPQIAEAKNAVFVIKTIKKNFKNNKETYKLKITKGKIIIEAGTKAGLWLGINRLRAILSSDIAQSKPDGSIHCPSLEITDWPDYPTRGMFLEMSQSKKYKKRIWRTVDFMSKLGYNLVILEIGGRFESKKYPEKCHRPWWTKKEIKELIAYAKARGITPIPGTNGPGHLERALKIFPLKSKVKGSKKVIKILDITNPEFYKVYLTMLGELVEIFDNPPYVHIGGDECGSGIKMLADKSGMSAADLYAEYANKINDFLSSKGIKTVMWQDMFITGKKVHLEPRGAGKFTYKALNKINSNVIIDVWAYHEMNSYKGLETIAASKHEMWVTPWHGKRAIARLCSEGKRLKATGVIGSTWWTRFHFMGGVVLTAECAWNTPKTVAPDPNGKLGLSPSAFSFPRLAYNPVYIVNSTYYNRGTKKYKKNVKQISDISGSEKPSNKFMEEMKKHFPGMLVNASGIPVKITKPFVFRSAGCFKPVSVELGRAKLRKLAGKRKLFAANMSKVQLGCYWVTLIDQPKWDDQTAIYTPSFGKVSKSNYWSKDWAVSNGVIISKGSEVNAKIPSDGYVLSSHGRNIKVFSNFSKGDRLELFESGPIKSPVEPIKIALKDVAKKKKILMFFTAEYPVFQSMVIQRKGAPKDYKNLAEITMKFSDNSEKSFKLNTLRFRWQSHYKRWVKKDWSSWIAWQDTPESSLNSIVALEWAGSDKIPTSIIIKPETYGIYAELVFLGAVALD